MKRILYFSGLLIVSITGMSCSDNFLSKNKKDLYTLSDTLYLNNNQSKVETSVQLSEVINSDYTIFMQPRWLSFDLMHGKVTHGDVPLSFTIIKGNIPAQYPIVYQKYYGTVILDVEDVGLISFIVAYSDIGSPALQCSTSSINFESSGSQIFTISNTHDGILKWEITGIPDWLLISTTSGTLNSGNSTSITASLNWDKIPQGQDLSANLQIKSNSTTDSSFAISVHVSLIAIIPPAVKQISGVVTDAEYSHESGIMAICTKSPNSLIIFNTKTNESNTVSLGKTPNCVSLSDDGHKAVIGYSVASVSYIDIDSRAITVDYTIDCVPYDIVLGENGWCYITPAIGQWVYLRNLNLNSGELLVGTNWSTLYEKTIIRKIHGKPYLVGTRTGLSPTGILIFDITKGKSSDSISYYHVDIGNFWISADGTRLYTRTKKVYTLPKYNGLYNTTAPPVYGLIETGLSNISGFDECPAINSIFVFSAFYDYSPGNATLIEQYNTTNLNKINKFNVSSVLITENGIRNIYETNPRFIFVNKEGSTLYVIKNLKETLKKDYWTIETIQL